LQHHGALNVECNFSHISYINYTCYS